MFDWEWIQNKFYIYAHYNYFWFVNNKLGNKIQNGQMSISEIKKKEIDLIFTDLID